MLLADPRLVHSTLSRSTILRTPLTAAGDPIRLDTTRRRARPRILPSAPADRSPDQRFVLSSLSTTLYETREDATGRKPQCGDSRSLERASTRFAAMACLMGHAGLSFSFRPPQNRRPHRRGRRFRTPAAGARGRRGVSGSG